MAKIDSNGIQIEVNEHGPASGPPIVMIMGLAAQLTRWPSTLIDPLVDQGFRVITFDNRDIGLSEKLDTERAWPPALVGLLDYIGLAGLLAPYKLTDMADDTVGLLDALNIDRAHVVGASMGGMIGQIVCAEHPRRVKSFTAIMSSTNRPGLPKADPGIRKEILGARTSSLERDELIDSTVRLWALIGTREGGYSHDELRQKVTAAVDRSTSPCGIRRQIAAIIATRDISGWTKRIKAPTLVLHGSGDPLVPVACGEDIAATIINARLEIIDGMGHDLPPRHAATVAEYMLAHLQVVEKTDTPVRAA